jgi:hypothetical protein
MRTTFLALTALLAFSFVAAAADINGKYTAEIPGRNGTQTTTFTFKTNGSAVEGTMTNQRGDTPIEAGKLEGDSLTFTITRPGRNGGDPMKTVYNGKIKGDTIEFTVDNGRGPQTYTAKKAM